MSSLEEMCKMYLGLFPFNTFTNICYHNSYFYQKIVKKYGLTETDSMISSLKMGNV